MHFFYVAKTYVIDNDEVLVIFVYFEFIFRIYPLNLNYYTVW